MEALAHDACSMHSADVPDTIREDTDGWSLVRHPLRIDQIQLDFRFSLMLEDGTLIIIESPFVATIDRVAVTVTPETLQHVELHLRYSTAT